MQPILKLQTPDGKENTAQIKIQIILFRIICICIRHQKHFCFSVMPFNMVCCMVIIRFISLTILKKCIRSFGLWEKYEVLARIHNRLTSSVLGLSRNHPYNPQFTWVVRYMYMCPTIFKIS